MTRRCSPVHSVRIVGPAQHRRFFYRRPSGPGLGLSREALEGQLVYRQGLLAEALATSFLLKSGGRREVADVSVPPP